MCLEPVNSRLSFLGTFESAISTKITNIFHRSWQICSLFLFEFCSWVWQNMSAVPQGAYIARKMRCQLQKDMRPGTKSNPPLGPRRGYWRLEMSPLKYNSKLMNSIWGLYNRYSVHNFKKNNDANMVAELIQLVEQHRYIVVAMSTSGSLLVKKALAITGALGLN